MSDAEKLVKIKTLLGINSTTQDSELYTLLDQAREQILNKAFPYDQHKTEVPSRYDQLHCQLTVVLYNYKGAEGESEHNENGVNRKYKATDDLLKEVVPMAGVFH